MQPLFLFNDPVNAVPDFRPVGYVVGLLLMLLAGTMSGPALIDFFAEDRDWVPFAASAGMTLFVGGTLSLAMRPRRFRIGIREAFLLTAASWIAVSLFAALPLYLEGRISYTDAFFEAVSGLTTTGSTVLGSKG